MSTIQDFGEYSVRSLKDGDAMGTRGEPYDGPLAVEVWDKDQVGRSKRAFHNRLAVANLRVQLKARDEWEPEERIDLPPVDRQEAPPVPYPEDLDWSAVLGWLDG
jgi:hypothetical protein